MPFPKEEVTPPVTKINLAITSYLFMDCKVNIFSWYICYKTCIRIKFNMAFRACGGYIRWL